MRRDGRKINALIARFFAREFCASRCAKACGDNVVISLTLDTNECLKTLAGKWVPLNPEPVFVIEDGGIDRFVSDEGQVITGWLACPEEIRFDTLVAFVPHWKTCMRGGHPAEGGMDVMELTVHEMREGGHSEKDLYVAVGHLGFAGAGTMGVRRWAGAVPQAN